MLTKAFTLSLYNFNLLISWRQFYKVWMYRQSLEEIKNLTKVENYQPKIVACTDIITQDWLVIDFIKTRLDRLFYHLFRIRSVRTETSQNCRLIVSTCPNCAVVYHKPLYIITNLLLPFNRGATVDFSKWNWPVLVAIFSSIAWPPLLIVTILCILNARGRQTSVRELNPIWREGAGSQTSWWHHISG